MLSIVHFSKLEWSLLAKPLISHFPFVLIECSIFFLGLSYQLSSLVPKKLALILSKASHSSQDFVLKVNGKFAAESAEKSLSYLLWVPSNESFMDSLIISRSINGQVK